MKRIVTALLLSTSLSFAPAIALACDHDGKAPAADSTPAPAGAAVVAYTVEGMHCEGCADKVEAAVRKLPGIYTVSVDMSTRVAKIAFDDKKVSAKQIKAAIAKLGYKPAAVA